MAKFQPRTTKDLSQKEPTPPTDPAADGQPGTNPATPGNGSSADGASATTTAPPESGGPRWFEVRLPHCPARVFRANNEDEAIEKFNRFSGISQTDWTHTVAEVPEPAELAEGRITAPPAPPKNDEE
jgi:hypothetical protein